jgi:hypothetical protein
MIISDLDQQKLDRFCYILYQREKVNRLRLAEYAKANRLKTKLELSIRGHGGQYYNFSKKMCEKLYNLSLDEKVEMMKKIGEHSHNYRTLGKFLRSKRKMLTTERKKALMWVCWDGANNFKWIRIEGKFRYGQHHHRDYTLFRDKIIERAQNYIMEKHIFGAKHIKNPYSLRKVDISNECKKSII